MPTMPSDQVRAARALLGLSQGELAKAAGVSVPVLKRAEGGGTAPAAPSAVEKIRAALEKAGVVLLPDEGEGPGVRLGKRRRGRQSIPVEELTAENDE